MGRSTRRWVLRHRRNSNEMFRKVTDGRELYVHYLLGAYSMKNGFLFIGLVRAGVRLGRIMISTTTHPLNRSICETKQVNFMLRNSHIAFMCQSSYCNIVGRFQVASLGKVPLPSVCLQTGEISCTSKRYFEMSPTPIQRPQCSFPIPCGPQNTMKTHIIQAFTLGKLDLFLGRIR